MSDEKNNRRKIFMVEPGFLLYIFNKDLYSIFNFHIEK